MKRILVAALVVLLLAPAAHADLRYTTHVEVRTTSSAAGDPTLAALRATLKRLIPAADTRTFVGKDAVRVEVLSTTESGRAVRAMLLLRDGKQAMLDLDARTYWYMPDIQTLVAQTPVAKPTYRRTGEFAAILGLKAERIAFTVALPLAFTPPGFPTVLELDGELWLAEAYKAYARIVASAVSGLTAMAGALPEGMVLRQLVRNAELRYEVESTVTGLTEEPLPADLFRVPEDFREVASPPLAPPPVAGRR